MKSVFTVFILMFLYGCASTTGYREDKTVKSDLDFRNNTGFIILYFPVDAVTSDESNLSSLGTTQDIAPKAETSLSRASQAGQAVSKLGAGLQMLEDMSTYLKTDQAPPTPAVATTPTAVKPPPVILNDPPSKISNDSPSKIPVKMEILEEGSFYKVADNGRTIWYWSKQMDQYPDVFYVTMEGCGTFRVQNEGVRIDYDEEFNVVAQNESSDRTFITPTRSKPPAAQIMTLVGPKTCKTERAYITTSPTPTNPSIPSTIMSTYESDQYEDGRFRYLFRGTMEGLPDTLNIRYNGKDIYTVDKQLPSYTISAKYGGRYENGRVVLKNSHGRVNSITLLLPKELSKGTAQLIY